MNTISAHHEQNDCALTILPYTSAFFVDIPKQYDGKNVDYSVLCLLP